MGTEVGGSREDVDLTFSANTFDGRYFTTDIVPTAVMTWAPM